MAKTLLDNRSENPYYPIIHAFLNRQVVLRGNYLFLVKKIKTDVGFLGMHMIVKHPRTGENTFFQNSFRIDENNKAESFRYLINYLTLSITAQSFEAFETFMKDTYRKNLSLHIPNEAVLSIATKHIRSTSNGDILKLLKTICPALKEVFDEDIASWIQKIELIRHRIVHNDQTIDEKTIARVKHHFINDHFTFEQIPNSDERRIFAVDETTEIIVKGFQDLAYSTFVLISEHEGYPAALRQA